MRDIHNHSSIYGWIQEYPQLLSPKSTYRKSQTHMVNVKILFLLIKNSLINEKLQFITSFDCIELCWKFMQFCLNSPIDGRLRPVYWTKAVRREYTKTSVNTREAELESSGKWVILTFDANRVIHWIKANQWWPQWEWDTKVEMKMASI